MRELGINVRSVCRDIDTLRRQGAGEVIGGEAGEGFVLQRGCVSPRLMFDANGLEALLLGTPWVSVHADGEVVSAARSVLGKIWAVLPPQLVRQAQRHSVYPMDGAVYQSNGGTGIGANPAALR